MRAAQPLKLETLFGSGPVGSPFVYALDAPNDERRTKLRLGRMRWDEKGVEPGCPFRDIARTPAENVTGIDRSIAGHRVALTEALVADPRNDDHAIMSQLTALFALLHNGLVDIVRRGEPAAGINANLGAAYKRFLCARDALTLIYHNIIRKDLMRRVMHPAIYAAYSGPAPDFIDRPVLGLPERDGWQVPLEFSHGAFRFGHAMVRPEYVINDLSTHDLNTTLEKTSANDPVNMPLDTTWIVRWSRFFEIKGSRPNFSRRMGPYLSDGLGNDQIFPAFDQTNRVGLLYRDLLGSALAGLWSVDALIAEIAVRRPQLVNMSRLLADRCYRVEPAPRVAGFRANLRPTDCRRRRDACQRSAAAVFHLVRGDAAAAGRGPVPWAAGLDHRVGSDLRRARTSRDFGRTQRGFACRRAR